MIWPRVQDVQTDVSAGLMGHLTINQVLQRQSVDAYGFERWSNRAATRAKDDHHRPDEAYCRTNCVPTIRASSFDGPQPYQ